MKKKLLSFILAICMFLPCSLLFSACGGDPHTHNWSTDWSYNSTEHWLTCDGCDDTKDKATHDGDVCSVCGYENQTNNNLPVEQNVRDLEVITIMTEGSGTTTLVKLPDGKNMLIDSAADNLASNVTIDNLLYRNGQISTIDYLVLTNTFEQRTGYADIFDYYNVTNLYKPLVNSNITPSEAYESTLSNASANSNCTIYTIEESNLDIDYSFRDTQGNTYNYRIDFMLPVDAANATDELDCSTVVSIEYQGKVIMITSDATEINIDGYCTKYGTQKNVDVLITSYIAGDQNAISTSDNRGTFYLSKIGLSSTDYVIILPTGGTVFLDSSLYTVLTHMEEGHVFTLSSDSDFITDSSVTITADGTIEVTAENKTAY